MATDAGKLFHFNLDEEPYRGARLARESLSEAINQELQRHLGSLTFADVDISASWSERSVGKLQKTIASRPGVGFLGAFVLSEARWSESADELRFQSEIRVRGLVYSERRGSSLAAARKLVGSLGYEAGTISALNGTGDLSRCLRRMLMLPESTLFVSEEEAESWSEQEQEDRQRELHLATATQLLALSGVDPVDMLFGFNLEPSLIRLLSRNPTYH